MFRQAVLSVLPNLTEEVADQVCDRLLEIGVESEEDLPHCIEADLTTVLKPIQARKLLAAWKRQDPSAAPVSTGSSLPVTFPGTSSLPVTFPGTSSLPVTLPGTSSLPVTSPGTSSLPAAQSASGEGLCGETTLNTQLSVNIPTQNEAWAENFAIPLNTMTVSICNALREGKPLCPSDRRHFVRIIVDAMRNYNINPSLKECNTVGCKVAELYPKSFVDRPDKGGKPCRYSSIVMQIKMRVENVNRNITEARKRKPRTRRQVTSTDSQKSHENSNTATDSYEWQPTDTPKDESEESMEAQQQELVSLVDCEESKVASSYSSFTETSSIPVTCPATSSLPITYPGTSSIPVLYPATSSLPVTPSAPAQRPLGGSTVKSHLSLDPQTQSGAWTKYFAIPLNAMTVSICHALREGKPLEPSDRRYFVRIIVDAMRNYNINPNMKECKAVGYKIVELYPNSFMDRTDEGEKLGNGYTSIVKQIKMRVENVNRSNTEARKRKSKSEVTSSSTDDQKPLVNSNTCTATDSYDWPALKIPKVESEQHLEGQQQFCEGPKVASDCSPYPETMPVTYPGTSSMPVSYPATSTLPVTCPATSSVPVAPSAQAPRPLDTSTVNTQLCVNPPTQSEAWTENFAIPLSAMPVSIGKALREGKPPCPSDRRLFVRLIVDAMRNYSVNPSITECTAIGRRIVELYPNSFMDRTDEGEKLGRGYTSIVTQIKTRVENVNRNNAWTRKRKPRCQVSSSNAQFEKSLVRNTNTATDSYGCILWQPMVIPEDENEESLELKRQELASLMSWEGANMASNPYAMDLMSKTYYLQRMDINITPPHSVTELKLKWPVLFLPRFILWHFEVLTGKPILQIMSETFAKKGRKIIDYFVSQENRNKTEVCEMLPDMEETWETDKAYQELSVVRLLMAHFGEKENSLFLFRDMTVSAQDMQSEDLPDTPRLILQGISHARCSHWMLSIEEQVVSEASSANTSVFLEGLAVLFASHYMLNLQYDAEASATLEFIQRCFVKINPEEGSKSSVIRKVTKSGKISQKKKESVNPKVTALLNNLANFKWKI